VIKNYDNDLIYKIHDSSELYLIAAEWFDLYLEFLNISNQAIYQAVADSHAENI
jgi:hypothetical protein